MSDINPHSNDTAAALDAGKSLAIAEQTPQFIEPGGMPFVIGGDGKVQLLEKLLDAPLRHKATVALDDVASFIEYITRFKQPGTLVFCRSNLNGGSFTAKLDHPEPGQTAWEGHVATLALAATPDWLTWLSINRQWQTQLQFCEFVEKQRHVFSEPTAADMLEISRSIEAKQEGVFKSGIRLPNGDRTLLWESTTSASAKGGTLEIPEEITITIVVFEGSDPVMISAFLRYRVESGAVKFLIEFQRPEEIIRASVKAARDNITSATGLPVFAGAATPQN